VLPNLLVPAQWNALAALQAHCPEYPADLDWDAPTPADAVAGRPLPYPPEENREITSVLEGETYARSLDRIAAGKARADAMRAAKQARWDAQVASRAAQVTASAAASPTSASAYPTAAARRWR
jgi:hypothetical protein